MWCCGGGRGDGAGVQVVVRGRRCRWPGGGEVATFIQPYLPPVAGTQEGYAASQRVLKCGYDLQETAYHPVERRLTAGLP